MPILNEMDNLEQLGSEIAIAINQSEGSLALTESVGEMLIDELLDDDFLESIPVISWIINAKKLYTSISDRVYLSKVSAVLAEMQTRPIDLKSGTIVTWKNPEDFRKFADTLVHQIDQLDGAKKAAIQGTLVRHLLAGRIDFAQYRAASYGLQNLFIDEIPLGETKLANYEAYPDERIPRTLERANLGYVTSRDGPTDETSEYFAKLDESGQVLAEAIAEISSIGSD